MTATAVAGLSVVICHPDEVQKAKQQLESDLREHTAVDFPKLVSVRAATKSGFLQGGNATSSKGTADDDATNDTLLTEAERDTTTVEMDDTVAPSYECRQRVVVPTKPLLGFSGVPVLKSRFLENLFQSRGWSILTGILLFFGICLPLLPSFFDKASLALFVSSQFVGAVCCIVAFGSQIALYDRGVMREVLVTFEFWFVLMELFIAIGSTVFYAYEMRGLLGAISSTAMNFGYLMGGFAVIGLDASRSGRKTKGVLMTLISLVGWTWAVRWGRSEDAVSKQLLPWHPLYTDLRTFISTSLITMAMFTTKYAVVCFFFKRDMILIMFSARDVPMPELLKEREQQSPGSRNSISIGDGAENQKGRSEDQMLEVPLTGVRGDAPLPAGSQEEEKMNNTSHYSRALLVPETWPPPKSFSLIRP